MPSAPTIDKLDRMTTRIAALIAKAEDPASTEAEAQSFMAKAEELMLRYAIDRSTLETKGTVTKEPVECVRFPFTEAKCFWTALGLNGAASIVNAVGLCSFAYVNSSQVIYLYGTKTDVEATQAMVRSVWMQARVGLKIFRANDPELVRIKMRMGTNNSVYWNAQYQYLEGFCRGFAGKIRESKEAVMESTGTKGEMVLVSRKAAADLALKGDGVTADKRSHTTGMILTDSYSKGRRDGRTASLGNEVGA